MPDGIVSADILATTMERYASKMVPNLQKRSPTLAWIARQGRSTDGGFTGRVFRQPLEYGFNTNVQFYRGAERFRVDKTAAFEFADFHQRQLVGTVVIEGIEESMNSGREAAVNFVTAKIKNLERSLQMIVAESAHYDGTENGGKAFTGLPGFIPEDPTLGTVGGLARSVQDPRGRYWWRSKVRNIDELPAVHVAGLEVRPMVRSLNRLKIDVNDGPDMADMLLQGDVHYVQLLEEIQEKQMITDTKRGGVGFTNIVYMPLANAPIIHDPLAPTNLTYMLNTEFLYQRKADRWMQRLPKTRPVNQDVEATTIVGQGNMTIANLERQGVLLDT